MIALLLALASTVPDYSDYREVVNEQRSHMAQVHVVQEQCESLLTRFSLYSRNDSRRLGNASWDNPGGWVDPSAINDAGYIFLRISSKVRDKIEDIQRSPIPRYENCKSVVRRGIVEHDSLLKALLYNGR